MKRIITVLCCFMFMFIFLVHIKAQEPGNNLGKSLSLMKRDFPALRYLKTDSKGDEYEDGYPNNGQAVFFYFRNNIVVEECMIIQDSNDFPCMWFNTQVKAFHETKYRNIEFKNGHYKFYYSYFTVDLIYVEENGNKTALVIYSPIQDEQNSNEMFQPTNSPNTYETPRNWYQVKVTYNESDVNGMEKIGYLKVKNSPTLFGSKSELEARREAIQKFQKKAFKKGAKIILITNIGGLNWDFLQVTVEGIMFR